MKHARVSATCRGPKAYRGKCFCPRLAGTCPASTLVRDTYTKYTHAYAACQLSVDRVLAARARFWPGAADVRVQPEAPAALNVPAAHAIGFQFAQRMGGGGSMGELVTINVTRACTRKMHAAYLSRRWSPPPRTCPGCTLRCAMVAKPTSTASVP